MIISPTEFDTSKSSEVSVRKTGYGNRHFGIRLANLIKNSNAGLVIGLESKSPSTSAGFVQEWQGYLDSYECSLKNVLIAADRKDSPRDATFMVISELYRLLDGQQESLRDTFKAKTAAALGALSKVSLTGGARAIDAGALHETVYRDDISNLNDDVAEATNSYVAERLDDALASRERVTEFRNFLSSLPDLIGNGQPIVIIIDGLRGCSPEFVASMLSTISQLFAVPRLAFVVTLSRRKIATIGRKLNGAAATTVEQLNKSFDIWAKLPENSTLSSTSREQYVTQCLDKMQFTGDKLTNAIFMQLAEYYELSIEEIERSLANLAIIENATFMDKSFGVLALSPYLAIIKVKFQKLYAGISSRSISLRELEHKTNLVGLTYPGWENISQPHPVRFGLHICYGDGSNALAADVSKLNIELFGAGDAINELVPILDLFSPA